MTVLYYLEPLITSRLLLLLVLLLLTLKHVRGSFRLKVGQTHTERVNCFALSRNRLPWTFWVYF